MTPLVSFGLSIREAAEKESITKIFINRRLNQAA